MHFNFMVKNVVTESWLIMIVLIFTKGVIPKGFSFPPPSTPSH